MGPVKPAAVALALCTLLATWSGPLGAWEPEGLGEGRPLVSLVPGDAGVCIELTNLYDHGQKLNSNPLLARFREFPPLAEWAKDNELGLDEIIARLAQALGVTPREMGDKLFGRSVILAAWPPEDREKDEPNTPAKPDVKLGADAPPSSADKSSAADSAEDGPPVWNEGQGLALVRATEPALAERLIRVLSGIGAPTKNGAAGPREVAYAGSKYLVRQIPRGNKVINVYLATLGPVAVLTNSETAMRGVLDLHAGNRRDALAASVIYQTARRRVADDAAIRVFVNPRAWDELMLDELREGIDEVEFVGAGLEQLWQAAQFWVAAIELDHGARIDSHLQFDRQRVTPELGDVLRSLEGSTDALARIRDDAVLAAALRIDLGKLATILLQEEGGRLDQFEDVRDMASSMFMGMDVIEDILPQLGPDVRVSLHETADGRGRPAAGWVVGVKTKPRAEGDDEPPVGEVLESGLGTALQVAATFWNNRFAGRGEKSEVREELIDGVKVTSLEGLRFLPGNLVPTFAVHDNYFLFGTSRQAVADSLNITPERSLAQQKYLLDLLGSDFATPGQLLYVDCPRLRKMLKDHPQLIRFVLGATRGLSTRQVSNSLARLDEVLALAETIVIATKFEDYNLSLTAIMSMDPQPQRDVARVAPAAGAGAKPEAATP